MQQFQSLQRLLIFYSLTLLTMLSLYYAMVFLDLQADSKQSSIDAFDTLQHHFIAHAEPTDSEIKRILVQPLFQDFSYQLVFRLPSGQTYIHQNTRPTEANFRTATFPTLPTRYSTTSSYEVSSDYLTGTIQLESGHQIHIVLRHPPLRVDWVNYRYWLPLMTAILLFIMALLYMFKRQTNWVQLLRYTDSLSHEAKKAYTPPPFVEENSTGEFLRLGNALSRVSYQLHNNHRRIKTLLHRQERLVDLAPLPMLMVMRQGQISFFNQRFEQLFIPVGREDINHTLTDFFFAPDESTQRLLAQPSTQRVTRTVIVYGLNNQQAYQLHITPWFGEHGQAHGFTVLINNVNELITHTDDLAQKNQHLQNQLTTFNQLKPMISHELRTPLETIIDTLRQVDPHTLTSQQLKLLDDLTQSSNTMLLMLNDLLDMEDTSNQESQLSTESVDLYRLGQAVMESRAHDARKHGDLELLYSFAPDCPRYINTDNKRLRKKLHKLLDNAINTATSGYVSLTISAIMSEHLAEESIEITDTFFEGFNKDMVSCWVRFSVTNTKANVDSALLNQSQTELGEAEHLDNATASDVNASIGVKDSVDDKNEGYTLTASNGIAHLLGGFITYKNNADNSSDRTLYLPCDDANYQSVYHRNQGLTQVHLIAIVNQPLTAQHLQRLCQYLSITSSIFTTIDNADIDTLTSKLEQDKSKLAPLLLLDYEYYQKQHLSTEDASDVSISLESAETKPALDRILAFDSLPKILLSVKSERQIPSNILYQYTGFLNKPLDSSLLLSEVLRLTSSARLSLPTPQGDKQNKNSSSPPLNKIEPLTNSSSKPLVLVVEDSVTNQKITCKLLQKLGYQSIIAENGQQALDKLHTQRQDIELILMDCRMPVMDGLAATQIIREQGDDITIVALTANNTDADRETCLAVGMDDFLSKPVNKNNLKTILDKYIGS